MRIAFRNPLSVVVILLLLQPFGCRRGEPNEESEPARPDAVEAGIHLGEEAQRSIGVVTAPVQSRVIPSNIRATGWLTIKPGNEVTIRAPVTGFVFPEEGQELAFLGDTVNAGQNLGALQIFVSPQEEAQLIALKEEADILIRQSAASLETAQARFERIEKLSDNGTVPGKEKQLAKEAVEQAKAAYEEAQQQLPFLPSEPYERPLRLRPFVIKSPIAGRLTKLFVQSRQLVVEGDPLWTISDWSSLWLRVPFFEGDLPRIDQTQPAEVTAAGLVSPIPATPIDVPRPTEDGRRTVDLFFEVPNVEGKLRLGEAVSVELPTGKKAKRIVVPVSAILWDGMAHAWVYLEEEDNQFCRRRIQVGPIAGEAVVVESGLSEGQSIVTVGAEALYGEEFKGQIQVLEDDD